MSRPDESASIGDDCLLFVRKFSSLDSALEPGALMGTSPQMNKYNEQMKGCEYEWRYVFDHK